MLQSVVKLAWWINDWVFIKSILHRLSYFQPRFSLSGVGTAALSSALCGGGNEDDDEQWDHFLNTDQ